MTALILQDPSRLKILIEYLQQQNAKFLLKKSQYLVGISRFLNKQQDRGLKQIKQSSQVQSLSYLKLNNLTWFNLLNLTQGTLQLISKDKAEQTSLILKNFIKALVESQKNGDLQLNEKQLQKNLLMVTLLNEYIQKGNEVIIQKIRSNTIFINSQSHIISMNIAHTLYLQNRYNQSSIFIKMALQTAIQLQEPYRVGLVLILMSKINHKLKLNWETVLLDVLKNKSVYSNAVIKECLQTYSRLLFLEKRFYQAQAYVTQAQKIEGSLQIEGLILPNYDFQF